MEITLIYGPTASGKSDYAINLAKQHPNSIIINADSQQVYQQIPILSAQPKAEEMGDIPHLLYGHIDYFSQYNAKLWLEDLAKTFNDCSAKGQNIFIVGGTGLYLEALVHGLFTLPPLDLNQKQAKETEFSHLSATELYRRLALIDQTSADKLNIQDRMRVTKALLYSELTGMRYSELTCQHQHRMPEFAEAIFRRIYLRPNRAWLYTRINQRFLKMIEAGAIEEVESLYHSNPSGDFQKATGAREIVAYLKGQSSYEEMVSRVQQLTRNYAKRQYTWFNNRIQYDLVIDNS